MKTLGYAFILSVLMALGTGRTEAGPPAAVGVSFGIFYSSLSSHGEWISVDGGVYAWRPLRVNTGWRPYWEGQWLWTNDGWYWDSDEPWAWATYHYGRWYYDDYYGWIWIPGYEWAPAWVEWRYGSEYVGWAPLGPYAIFHARFGIYYARHWVTPYHYWSFVDCGHLTHRRVNQYIYRMENNTRYIGRTRSGGSVRYEDGRVVGRGPDREFVERRGNIRIDRAEITDVGSRDQSRVIRSGDRARIDAYRPQIEERSGDAAGNRPAQVRERERVPSLDMRGTDLRGRSGPGDIERRIERNDRLRSDPTRTSRPSMRNERGVTPQGREQGERPERRIEPQARPRSREAERPQFEQRSERRTPSVERAPRSTPSPRIERSPTPQMRERPSSRPDVRREAPRSTPQRGTERRRDR